MGNRLSGKGRRMASILIADDELDLLEVMQATLDACGHTITPARNGAIARKLLAATRFECAVLDVVMPKIDGVRLLKMIRNSRSQGNLPVCLMTANPQERDRLLEKEGLAADVLLTKPFNTMDLIQAVKVMSEAGESQPDAEGRRLKITLPGNRRSTRI